MLAIRLQRRGRKGHAHFRVIVQDARRSPKSGRVVANIGTYNPHTKEATIDTEKAEFYLTNGAQPSDSAAKLLKREKVKLPEWVQFDAEKQRPIKNAEKLRKNAPADAAPAKEAEATEDAPTEEADTAPEATEEAAKDEAPAEEAPEAEKPAESDEKAAEEAPADDAKDTKAKDKTEE